MTGAEVFGTLGQPIHARFPVRWSTVLMLVLFVGVGNLYLEVRSPPRATLPGPLVTSTTTTLSPSTNGPADPTSTTQTHNDPSDTGNSGTFEAPSSTTTTSTPTPPSATSSTTTPAAAGDPTTSASTAP